MSRSSIPSALRFTSRNLRALYGKQHQRNPSNFTQTFPIEALALTPGSARSESMFPGTMDFFILTAPSSGSALGVSFEPTEQLVLVQQHARGAGECVPLSERRRLSAFGAVTLTNVR